MMIKRLTESFVILPWNIWGTADANIKWMFWIFDRVLVDVLCLYVGFQYACYGSWDSKEASKGEASQLTFTCPKTIVETLEKVLKYIQS